MAEHGDPYRAVSPEAGQAPDVFGPDGVRVTLRVEPAVDRLRRWFDKTLTPPVLDPVATYVDYQAAPGVVQKYLLRGRWIVDVEADNGERVRVSAESRDVAIEYARQISKGVKAQGVAFLRTFAS